MRARPHRPRPPVGRRRHRRDRLRAASIIVGSCPELTRHHMEVRGIGVINLRDLFGVASTRASKRVELVVQLEGWDPHREVRPARSRRCVFRAPRLARSADSDARCAGAQPAILVEVAARNQLLRRVAQRRARPRGAPGRTPTSGGRGAALDDPDEDIDPGGTL